jgi:hypothetical protein
MNPETSLVCLGFAKAAAFSIGWLLIGSLWRKASAVWLATCGGRVFSD